MTENGFDTRFTNFVHSLDILEEDVGTFTKTDEGTEFDGGETLLLTTDDMALQLTFEFWMKGNVSSPGNIITGVGGFGTPLFTVDLVGDDIVCVASGTSYTFINAYLNFRENQWTFFGVSFGVKFSGTSGMMSLFVYSPSNSITTGVFYEYVDGLSFAQWQTDQQGESWIEASIGQDFEGTISEIDYYTYFKVESEYLKVIEERNQAKYSCD